MRRPESPDNDRPEPASLEAPTSLGTAPTEYSPSPAPAGVAPVGEAALGGGARYEERRRLGVGGMGEVWLCRDLRIGREIARKTLRPGGNAHYLVGRFLREARIQGQLEHPAIVPVYDLGEGPDGAPYFTMKRVRGMTLEAVLAGLHAGAPELPGRDPPGGSARSRGGGDRRRRAARHPGLYVPRAGTGRARGARRAGGCLLPGGDPLRDLSGRAPAPG
jgi:hypothetical protein